MPLVCLSKMAGHSPRRRRGKRLAWVQAGGALRDLSRCPPADIPLIPDPCGIGSEISRQIFSNCAVFLRTICGPLVDFLRDMRVVVVEAGDIGEVFAARLFEAFAISSLISSSVSMQSAEKAGAITAMFFLPCSASRATSSTV
jgi:hypothetical protein